MTDSLTAMEEAEKLLRKIDACDCGPCAKEVAAAITAAREAGREEAAKIAEEYEEWTYWGQYDNFGAAVSASREIAKAIRLGRPLTSEEIREVDKSGRSRLASGGGK